MANITIVNSKEGTHYCICSNCGHPVDPWNVYCKTCYAHLEHTDESRKFSREQAGGNKWQ